MNNKTRFSTKITTLKLSNTVAVLLIILILSSIVLGLIKMKEYFTYSDYYRINPIQFMLIFIVFGGLLVLFPIVVLIKINKSVNKAKSVTINENKIIDTKKTFKYYRELPNNYGIGVNTLLVDNTLENYKDIVAVILDLCAIKYLYLSKSNNKYILKVLKEVDNNLLSNEKYILSLILNNELKNINYNEWFNYCYKDGKELNLFEQAKVEHKKIDTPIKKDNFSKGTKKIVKISLIISLFCIINPIAAIGMFMFSFIIMFIPYYIYTIIKAFNNIANMSAEAGYEIEMKNQLIRTEKGKKELEKVFAFKSFIKDFSRLTEKNIEEIYLWDRYLSYAQVFGLTKQIMKSGYKELISNSSFKKDDFDNITLDNIERKD